MTVLKCKMCGGDLNVLDEQTVCECEYCGTRQTVPKADDEKKLKLFARAGRLLRACEFDKAAGVYEAIVADFDQEAEAYWGLILCKYGIEYVDDPATGKKIPTCHRSSFDGVLDDANFELVMENADAIARPVYRAEAKEIERLRKGILEVSAQEEPYDVFICYKETDEQGDRTVDSLIAQDVYTALTEKGYRVFFSRISLEDKLGQEYEPYIFAALHSARVMLAFGTSYENYDAVWVKNEWSRYLALIAKGEKKTLIPCYKDLDAYDMPKELHRFQAQDMGKVGALQDLVRGVEKIIGKKKAEPVQIVQQAVVSGGPNVAALLERGNMALEDQEWEKAKEYFDQVLSMDAENAKAFLGLAMAAAKAKDRDAYASVYTAADSPLRKTEDKNTARARKFDKELNAWFNTLDAKGKQADNDLAIEMQAEQERATDQINHLAQIRKRNSSAQRMIAAGENHTVGLRLDGTVVATGSNENGQCEVTGWKDIIAVAAGKYHTVGLKIDGTVVATEYYDGPDDYKGQCDVSDWKDIVAVAAGDYHTVGLREDGTVVAVGDKNGCAVGDWKDIVAIAAGSSETVGLRANGTVVTTEFNKLVKNWSDIVDVAGGNWFTFGLKPDGKVIATEFTGDQIFYNGSDAVSSWSDIVAISAGLFHTVGLKADGTVLSTKFDGDFAGQSNVEHWMDIVAVAASNFHTVGLRTDGTVVAVGLDLNGQCKVTDWKLFDGLDRVVSTFEQRKQQREEEKRRKRKEKFAAQLQAARELEERRNQLKKCVFTTMKMITIGRKGDSFIAGLKADGTVSVFKDKEHSFIHLDGVESWNGIVAIAAGREHLIGLKADGTVVAAGRGWCDEHDVSGWRNIVAIAAAEYHSLGLCADGTVVATGRWMQDKVSDWNHVVAIATGKCHAVGLRSDGTVIATKVSSEVDHGQSDVDRWRNIIAIAAGEYYTAGLKADGTVVTTQYKGYEREVEKYQRKINTKAWRDVVAVSVGPYHVTGLKSDGSAVTTEAIYYSSGDGVSSWTDIVAIDAGEYCTIGLKSDGSVISNRYADALKDWKLFDSAYTIEEERKAIAEKAEAERQGKIAALTEEKESLKTELSNLRGLFTGRRRREIEARIEEIDTVLEKLG